MPFASLTEMVPDECPRLLLNLDHVGNFGSRMNDVEALMPCDSAVRELCRLLGWEEELERLWAETELKVEEAGVKEKEVVGGDGSDKEPTTSPVVGKLDSRSVHLSEVVEGIAEKVAAASREAPQKPEDATKADDSVDSQSDEGRAETHGHNAEEKTDKGQSLPKKDPDAKVKNDVVDELASIVKEINIDEDKEDKANDVEDHHSETGKT